MDPAAASANAEEPLTAAQRRVLQAIDELAGAGVRATRTAIAATVGLRGHQGLDTHVRALVRKGRLAPARRGEQLRSLVRRPRIFVASNGARAPVPAPAEVLRLWDPVPMEYLWTETTRDWTLVALAPEGEAPRGGKRRPLVNEQGHLRMGRIGEPAELVYLRGADPARWFEIGRLNGRIRPWPNTIAALQRTCAA